MIKEIINTKKEVEEFFTDLIKGAKMQLDTILDLVKSKTYN